MPNTLITPDWITKESARILVNMLKFAGNINRQYDDQYTQAGAKVGYTVKARMPQRFRTTKGQALQVQSMVDTYVPVTLTDQANVGVSYSTASATMEIDAFRDRTIRPAAQQLANTIDYDGLNRCYLDVWQSVGTPGTAISSNLTYLQGGAKLTNSAAPMPNRQAILDPLSMVNIANANLSLFNPQSKITDAFEDGAFATNTLGFANWYQDQNVARHLTGSFTASTPIIGAAGQTGSTLATTGWASGATILNQGDVFTIAGVYAVNPQNYASTGELQQFVVTARTVDAAGAIAALPFSPAIITSGAFQTVTNSPASGAAITVLGATSAVAGVLTATSSSQALLFHPDAFTMVMADLEYPEGGAESSRISNNALGVSLRYVRQYSIQTDQNAARLDALYGFKTIRPELAVRAWGA
jgi:hypothetical protein